MDANGPAARPKTRWYTSQQIPRTPPDQKPVTLPRTPPDQNPGTPPRTPSRQSRASSHVSSNKTSSSLRVLKRAKADAAIAKLQYSEKETELIKQAAILSERANKERAFIEAELRLVSDQKEAAAALAEADAVDRGFDEESHYSLPNVGSIDSKTKVKKYLQSQSEYHNVPANYDQIHVAPPIQVKTEVEQVKVDIELTKHKPYNYVESVNHKDESQTRYPLKPPIFTPKTLKPGHSVPSVSANLDNINEYEEPYKQTHNYGYPTTHHSKQSYIPPHHSSHGYPIEQQSNQGYDNEHDQNECQDINNNTSVAKDFTYFLLKKDLQLSRFITFNDQPESYPVWKASFKNIANELNVNSREELDLLVKYLGPESTKQAMSIRIANADNPDTSVKKVWERLEERYGGPELIETALKKKLSTFPKLSQKDYKKMYELSDILSEIESLKGQPKYSASLAYFDSATGVNQVVSKLPYNLQTKWMDRASRYKNTHSVTFPPFHFFVNFVKEMSKIFNDPSFTHEQFSSHKNEHQHKNEQHSYSRHKENRPSVKVTKTDIDTQSSEQSNHDLDLHTTCPLHKCAHNLNECKAFRCKPLHVRRRFLNDKKICYRCCESTAHKGDNCPKPIKCIECDSESHPTALHVKRYNQPITPATGDGGEKVKVTSHCTDICDDLSYNGKSCAKIVLVKVYPDNCPDMAILTYALIDEQSNRSLAKAEIFNQFNINTKECEYSVSSCAGSHTFTGRVAKDLVIQSLDGSGTLNLPPLIECNNIPDNREEIATPEIASYYPHLRCIQDYIPPLNENARTLILIGRDLIEAHHVLGQERDPEKPKLPFGQKLRLGWVIIGQICDGKVHTSEINVNKTYIVDNGRTTLFEPCENKLDIHEYSDGIGSSVFKRTLDDNKLGMSRDDKQFIHIMNENFEKTETGNWQAPLPFRTERTVLPNNRNYVLRRTKNLQNSLMKDKTKCEHMLTFVGKMLESGHAELAPPLKEGEECWYLPIFGVYHQQKPNQIRAVFDSSAQFQGQSLNDNLLSGPDLTNSLLHVLLRFRTEPIAIVADIQQMFHSFLVKENHRNYLRFFWFKNNDPRQELVEYRMTVHVFGNRPSPAVANYGLHKTADESEEKYGSDVKEFIKDHFYVDDGLISLPTAAEAVDLMKRSMEALKDKGNLRLHKIASNSQEVMSSFPINELAKDLKDLDFSNDTLPVQRSLGLSWDLETDTFTFLVSIDEKPYTRRGVLSVINSLYDPLGFAAPVIIAGKLFLRKVMSSHLNWDDPLPTELEPTWIDWKNSLSFLEKIEVPRQYTSRVQNLKDMHIRRTYMSSTASLRSAVKRELHVYSDASEHAVAAVAYLVTISNDNEKHVGFVMGKAKVAPKHGHSIPRLELCGALLAVELYEIILSALNTNFDHVQFHIDSKVVLGYINNRTRRFYMYVSNRVEKILRITSASQWKYVPTSLNPADSGTRSLSANQLQDSAWLLGPKSLYQAEQPNDSESDESFQLINPEDDNELKPETTVQVMKGNVETITSLGTHRFDRFSTWRTLVRSIAMLQHIIISRNSMSETCKGWHFCSDYKSVESNQAAERWIIRTVQQEVYSEENKCLVECKPLSRSSSLLKLDPFIDEHGLICVGGRLRNSQLNTNEKFPYIIPSKHHIATLLVRHHHQEIKHQGRFFTENSLRTAGIWIIGAKRLISSLIYACVKCRKLRGSPVEQKMADLPEDRVDPAPPFTYVGVDVFGPWSVVTRRTRGGSANSKRWGVLFTCLTVRAVHIELVEEMTSSAFISALRRFIAIRGPVKEFRSDRGTNFVGSTTDLGFNTINVEDPLLNKELLSKGTVWRFNPPHSSHMGGIWERMIGVSRKILDSMLSEVHQKNLTHDVLVTFMCEVSAIINARPIVPITSDPASPFLLSPSMLLTQKSTADVKPFENIDPRDMYRAQWRLVQCLAETFWKRWRLEYLQSLQTRRKWQYDKPNLKSGDIVLLIDTNAHRNDWPLGVVVNALPGKDNRVRKAEVKIIKDGQPKVYTRPVTELVLLGV